MLLRGVTAAIIGKSLSMILSAVAQTLIVRALSVMLYGEYATIGATLGLISIVLGVGLDTWMLHDVSRNPDRLMATIRDVLVLKGIGAVLLLVIVMLVWSTRVVNAPAFLIGATGIVFEAFAMTGYSALRALKRNGIVALFQTMGAILQLALIWFCWRSSTLNITFIFGIQTSSSLCTALTIFWYLWQLSGMRLPKGLQIRRVIRGSWLLVISDILATIYGQVVIVALGMMAGAEAAGIFRPALSIIIYSFIVPSLILAVGLPILNENRFLIQRLQKLTALMILMTSVYGIGVIIILRMLGDVLIDTIYGFGYSGVFQVIKSVDIVILLKSINMVFISVLIVQEKMKLRVITQIITTFYSILGSIILIPLYGLNGAIIMVITIEIFLFVGYGISTLRALNSARI